jgi:hypothetical protein
MPISSGWWHRQSCWWLPRLAPVGSLVRTLVAGPEQRFLEGRLAEL